MSVSAAEVRARVATSLEGVAVGSHGTLREAPCTYDTMPDKLPQTRSHMAFAVQVGRTLPMVPQRQRLGVDLLVTSDVSVRFTYRLRPDVNAVADTGGAMEVEQSVLQAVLATERMGGLQMTYQGTSVRQHATTPTDLYMVQLDFRAVHNLSTE